MKKPFDAIDDVAANSTDDPVRGVLRIDPAEQVQHARMHHDETLLTQTASPNRTNSCSPIRCRRQ